MNFKDDDDLSESKYYLGREKKEARIRAPGDRMRG